MSPLAPTAPVQPATADAHTLAARDDGLARALASIPDLTGGRGGSQLSVRDAADYWLHELERVREAWRLGIVSFDGGMRR